MRKQFKSKLTSGFIVMALALFATSCSTDDGSVFETPTDPTGPSNPDTENPAEPEVATLVFNESDPSSNVPTAETSGEVGTNVPGRVIFTSSETNQLRMYITQNVSGGGAIPFQVLDIDDPNLKDETKGDGSIDLDGSNKKAIDFTFELPVPDIDNGEIVYTFWTTTGKGDFRDSEKRLALGEGTITVTVGNGTNPAAEVRSFTGIKLFAPRADGNSETFFSLLNETVYNITDGPEFRAFWDFGYYYTNDATASFASTANYKTVFDFDVEGFEAEATEDDAENETLNEAFFELSAKTTAEFDAIALSGELNEINQALFQNIENLNEGDVIEFVDNYGKKGLIKV
ncbi:hypothetical protein LCGC14_1688800, partial [marine sediment metagenome]